MINKVVKWRIRRSLSKNYTTIWTLFFYSYSKGSIIVRQVTEDSFLLTTHRWRRNRTKMLCPVSKEVSLWSNDFNNSLQLKGNEFLLLDSPIMRNIFSLSIGKAHLEFSKCIKEIFCPWRSSPLNGAPSTPSLSHVIPGFSLTVVLFENHYC